MTFNEYSQKTLYSSQSRLNKIGGKETVTSSKRCGSCQEFTPSTLPCESYSYASPYTRTKGNKFQNITKAYGSPQGC